VLPLGTLLAGILGALFASELRARATQRGDEPERVVALRRTAQGGYAEEEPEREAVAP
jgi:hypothetical protein